MVTSFSFPVNDTKKEVPHLTEPLFDLLFSDYQAGADSVKNWALI